MTLPWTNIDTLLVKFTEDVNPATLIGANVKVFGVLAVPGVSGAITFDNATNLAKITLASPITSNRLRLEIGPGVQSLAGATLDGDLNSVPGGTYNFLFNVQPGDRTYRATRTSWTYRPSWERLERWREERVTTRTGT